MRIRIPLAACLLLFCLLALFSAAQAAGAAPPLHPAGVFPTPTPSPTSAPTPAAGDGATLDAANAPAPTWITAAPVGSTTP